MFGFGADFAFGENEKDPVEVGCNKDKDLIVDIAMPDIRQNWQAANESKELHGCGLHKNFNYEELCSLESSLRERRILADVPTADVVEFKEQKKKVHRFTSERIFGKTKKKADELIELKDQLKKEIMKELAAELSIKELLAEVRAGKQEI